MRPGLPLAILLHILLFGAGYVVLPHTAPPLEEDLIIVPVDLVVIADSTNLSMSRAEKPKEDEPPAPLPDPTPTEEPPAEDTPEPEDPARDALPEDPPVDEPDAPAPAEDTAPPEPDTTTPPEPEPEPEPEPAPEEKTPPEKPAPSDKPEKPVEKAPDNSFLERALKTAEKKKQERTRSVKTAPDLKQVQDARESTRSAGDRKRDTATWTALLKSKLETKCYRDTSDMANADRLRVTYAITFAPDGSLLHPPRRLKPSQIPQGDQQLRVFNINAMRAIQKCAPYDDIFPPELYEEWKDFTFVFGK